jgi:hypothetical protein
MRVWIAVVLLCSVACGAKREEASVAASDTSRPWAKPGDRIDSILPMEEYVRRFRAGLTAVEELEGGAEGREALAKKFFAAVSARDTMALRAMLLSPAEFSWLVFPDHRYAEPPYELDPSLFWLQLTAESSKGIERVLQRYGGTPLTFQRLECTADTLQMLRGPTTIWGPCTVGYRTADSTLTRRLFGSIVERNGKTKFVSYNNEF